MKNWPIAASAVLLIFTGGCKTVIDYGHNPGGGDGGSGHPWAARWNPPAPPAPPVAQSAPAPAVAAPAPAPAVQVTPVPATTLAPTAAPAPAPVRAIRRPRKPRG